MRERKFFHLKFVVTYFDLHVIRVTWRNIENQCFILPKKKNDQSLRLARHNFFVWQNPICVAS